MAVLSVQVETDRRRLDSVRGHFGDMMCALLDDPDVTDVMLQDGVLFEDRRGSGMTKVGQMTDHAATGIINTIAATFNAVVNQDNPVFEGELPIRGARFIAFVRPLTPRPAFSIRIPAPVIYPFSAYVSDGIMTQHQCGLMEGIVTAGRGVVISGGTGAGKSTFLNALLDALYRIHPHKRVLLIEEIIELQCRSENVLALRTGPMADHQTLLMRGMRTRPDVIVLGEVRDKAAYTLVKAANTGHDALYSTIHANSAHAACKRTEQLCSEALPGVNLREQIAAALDIVVSITRTDPMTRKDGDPERRVNEVVQITGVEGDQYISERLA